MRHTRIIVIHYGGPDALQVLEEECPEPNAGDVRVKVLAAGVSLPDILAREGVHPETPRLPFTPGWDLIGAVDELGDGVSGIEPGRIVAAMPISGAYAEFVCLPHRELVPVPPGLDPAEAVSLILNYITAYQMLHRSAQVKPGQRVLVHGAAGGVGTALLQLGRLVEAKSAGLKPTAAGTDIFGGLWQLKALLESGSNDASVSDSKTIWIASDMMNESATFKMPALLPAGPQEMLVRAKANGQVVPLQGYKIHVVGASPAGLTPQAWNTLRTFWTLYFREAGAELVSYSAECNTERD